MTPVRRVKVTVSMLVPNSTEEVQDSASEGSMAPLRPYLVRPCERVGERERGESEGKREVRR